MQTDRFLAGIPVRVCVFVAVLAIELIAVEQLPHPWLTMHQVMAGPIVFGLALLIFGREKLQDITARAAPKDSRLADARLFVLHLVCLGALCFGDAVLHERFGRGEVTSFYALGAWLTGVAVLVVTWTGALFSLRRLRSALAGFGVAWLYAGAVAAAVMSARVWVRWLWDASETRFGYSLQRATFFGVEHLLRLFYSGVIVVPATLVLGTTKFQVIVAGTCSGIEGVALMLLLTLGWLVYARRELRVERALLLVPIAMAAVWLLNLVRIAALIALGDAGHAEFALNGFHSEAGWILFNAVALGFLLAAQHVRWLRKAS